MATNEYLNHPLDVHLKNTVSVGVQFMVRVSLMIAPGAMVELLEINLFNIAPLVDLLP